MNVRPQIVCWVLIVMALFGTTMCRSGGDDVTPVPTVTKAETDADSDAAVEVESTVTPEQLPVIVAQIETSVPSSPTRTARPTRIAVPTDTPDRADADADISEETEEGEDDVTPTRTRLAIRTEEPTLVPEVTPKSETVASTSTPLANVLLLPTPRTYTVRDGDTISAIAYFCEVTTLDLLAENGIDVEDADKIVPGQVLRVPESN